VDAPARLGKKWSETGTPGWGGQLSRELGETAARRLGILGLLTAGTFVFFAAGHLPISLALREGPRGLIGLGSMVCAIILSLTMFGLARRRHGHPRFLLGAGLVYQLAMAVVIAVVDNLSTQEHVGHIRGWSGLAVWILIFAVFIPSTPRRTLWVSAVIAALDPVTVLLATALGLARPPLVQLPLLFAPTVVAVFTAVIAARINYRTAYRLREARELGSYRLVKLLGRGGMGEVWRAEHRMLARPAAIKLIRSEMLMRDARGSAESALRRFEREAQATALMQSEHTIEVYDFGVADDGSFYYVMELLEGLNLEELVRQFGFMPPPRAVHCLVGVCDSLAEAHASGLIHRDIKPSNIFLCRRGLTYDRVKVLDFGLVTATARGDAQSGEGRRGAPMGSGEGVSPEVVGTPAYMAPEIIEGADVIDGRADLYAVGCLAYFLLSGRAAFEGASATAVILQHISSEPPPLRTRATQPIPEALEQVVHACLAKDPARRPQSALELRGRLEAVMLDSIWNQDSARIWWEAVAAAGQKQAAAGDLALAETTPQTVRPGPPRSS
jgi:eukaryotic-like serine/threonine-protein kinase